MLNSFVIKAHAKLNLFLRIIGLHNNGFHEIRSGITFLNLYDKLTVKLSDKFTVSYSGPFKPKSAKFNNDVIVKIYKKISLINKKNTFKVHIQKNIPSQAGLGSASTDAASLIKGLQQLRLLNNIDNKFLSNIGADVPACFYGKNCLVTGMGDEIYRNISFPKYYIILVKPKINLSTDIMYGKIKDYLNIDKNYISKKKFLKTIHEKDIGNDFEIIVKKENKKILDLLNFLSKLNKNIFSQMSGSGSCCFAVFAQKKHAQEAFAITKKNFKDYWIYLAENNV